MAFALVASASEASGTGSSVAVTVTATGANNLVVGTIRIFLGSETCSSVTDDKGNTYALTAAKDANGGSIRVYMFYGVQTTGGTTTVTCNFSASTDSKRIVANEFSGGQTTNAAVFDKTSNGTGSGTDHNLAVTSFTPTADGSLVVGGYAANAGAITWTAGTNYTLGSAANPIRERQEYRLSSSGAETAPISIAVNPNNWAGVACSFNVLSAAGTVWFPRLTLLGCG